MLATAVRPHIRNGFVPSMSFSLDHCVWIHENEFRMDDWMLYETSSSKAGDILPVILQYNLHFSGGSRAFIEGRLWSRDGRLIISTAQEALIRAPKV